MFHQNEVYDARRCRMKLFFLFDDIVNQILDGNIDDSFSENIKYIQNEHMARGLFEYHCIPLMIYSLYIICYETGKSDLMPYSDYVSDDFSIIFCEDICFRHLMLYSKKNTEKIRRSILDATDYCYIGENSKFNNLEMYHLIKNRFYEGVAQRLEKELLITNSMYSMSKMMGIAVKNKDIECLKLFLKKGFVFRKRDMRFLLDNYGNYMTEQVIPLLKKYAHKEASIYYE